MASRDVREEEHRPQFLCDRDVGDPEPAEEADDRHRNLDVPGHIEPVALAITDEGSAEADRHERAGEGEPQPGDRCALAPDRQWPDEVHHEQRDRDRGECPADGGHGDLLGGDAEQEHLRRGQPGEKRRPGKPDGAERPSGDNRGELVHRTEHAERCRSQEGERH